MNETANRRLHIIDAFLEVWSGSVSLQPPEDDHLLENSTESVNSNNIVTLLQGLAEFEIELTGHG